ncbi:hypothetical protein J6K67_07990 [Leuconostoc mesenteroides]|uniref:O-antigen ligase family protein n=1 Tax=Leuconostoc mesenteroides TaxID=1245 RepID=UPI001CC0E9FD|nr:hypothetical protein [Leuconostoc mesenteroides]MBZ1541213.1 hypothetical protein [Leuconostoc mesenteroides]
MKYVLKSMHSVVFIIGSFLVLFSAGRFVVPNVLSQSGWAIQIAVSLLLFSISILYDDWFVYELVIFAGLIAYTLVVFVNTKVAQPVFLVLVIISMRRITPETVMRNVFIVQSLLLIVNLTLYHFGVLYNYTSGPLSKHSFGFWSPNQFGVTILQLVVILLFLSFKGFFHRRPLLIRALAMLYFGILLILLYLSGSRGSEISAVIALVVYISLFLVDKIGMSVLRTLYSSVAIIPFILSLVTLSDSVNQVGSLLYKLNQILTTRVALGNQFFHEYGISMFGKDVVYHFESSVGTTYAFLDNEYLVYLINYGIVATAIFVGYILLLTNKVVITKRYGLLIAILPFAVYGFVEQGAGEAWVNFSMLFSSVFFIKNTAVSQNNMEV